MALGEVLRKDIRRNFPQGWRSLGNILSSPGIISLFIYRYNRAVTQVQYKILRYLLLTPGKLIEKIYGGFHGIAISRNAVIGGGFKIAHFGGIFVNSRVVIGENVTVSQGVTIGEWGPEHGAPTIGDRVYIGPGAKIFGNITVGSDVRIGANAVIFFDVHDNSLVLAPAPTVKPREENS